MKTVRNRGVTEIYQAEPILIERTRHSHRPNVMFSFGTASSERGTYATYNADLGGLYDREPAQTLPDIINKKK